MCRFLCPVSAVEKNETVTPRGKGTLAGALDRGETDIDAEAAEILYHCAGCKVCREHCASEVDLPEVLHRYRVRAVREGLAPAAARTLAARLDRDRSLHRPAGELAARLERYREMLAPGAGVLYFAGCSTAALYPEVIGATLRIFEAAGVEVTMLDPEECCGLPLYTLGYSEEASAFARRLAAAVGETGAQTVVSGCPMCVQMLRERYPALGIDLGVEVRHVTEFLSDVAAEGRLAGPSGSPGGETAAGLSTGSGSAGPVTYHDPCYLGRWLGVYEAPRRLLTGTAGLVLAEMESSREYAACCGGSAAVSTVTPTTAGRIAGRRLGEAVRTGAKTLVTACPHCLEMLRPAAPEGLAVLDITEVLARRLGIEPER